MRKQGTISYRDYSVGDAAEPTAWPGYEIERPMPGKVTVTAMWLIPFLTAATVGLVTGLLLTWLVVDVLEAASGWWPASGVLVGLCFGLVFWAKTSSMESMCWTVERWIDRDITGDNVVGRPEPEAHLVTIAGPGGSTAMPEARLRAEFCAFVRGCEVSTSLRRWETVLGRERYQTWRDGLIKLRWAEWLNPNETRQGWRLTRPAAEIIEAVF